MANPLIKISNIKRDFVLGNEIVYVLKGIDLQINKGQYVALILLICIKLFSAR